MGIVVYRITSMLISSQLSSDHVSAAMGIVVNRIPSIQREARLGGEQTNCSGGATRSLCWPAHWHSRTCRRNCSASARAFAACSFICMCSNARAPTDANAGVLGPKSAAVSSVKDAGRWIWGGTGLASTTSGGNPIPVQCVYVCKGRVLSHASMQLCRTSVTGDECVRDDDSANRAAQNWECIINH